jgi:hypothetical protein
MIVTVASRYRAHLHRGGIGIRETLRLLEAYARRGNWGTVRQEVLEGNLLGKTSGHQVRALLKAFRRRFLSGLNLPPVDSVGQLVRSPLPEAAKIQVLLPYYVLTDPLVERCYRDLVLPRLLSPPAELTTAEVRRHLESLEGEHPELCRWSKAMRERWVRGFRTLLRQFRLMDRHPSSRLRRPMLLPEPFGFYWLWLWERSGSFREAEAANLWDLYLLDVDERERLLGEGQVRGWWIYQRLGLIVHFHPTYTDLKEWLRHGLDRGHA